MQRSTASLTLFNGKVYYNIQVQGSKSKRTCVDDMCQYKSHDKLYTTLHNCTVAEGPVEAIPPTTTNICDVL